MNRPNVTKFAKEVGHATVDLFRNRRELLAFCVVLYVAMLYTAYNTDADHEVMLVGLVMLAISVGAVVQAYVEFRSWWAIHDQRDTRSLGHALRLKFFTLGWKNAIACLLYVVLGYALIFGTRLAPFPIRVTVYSLAFIAVVLAADAGIAVVRKLELDDRVEFDRTTQRETDVAERERVVGLDERNRHDQPERNQL